MTLRSRPTERRSRPASTDKLAKLWDWKAEMPAEKAKLEGHGDAVWAVAWAKDGSLATAGADRKIKLWNAEGKEAGDARRTQGLGQRHRLLARRQHARLGQPRPHRPALGREGKKGNRLARPSQQHLLVVTFSPDGSLLAVGTHNAGVRLWNIASKAEVFPAPAEAKKKE